MRNTKFIEKRIEGICLELVTKPVMNVIGVKLKKPTEVSKQLAKYGWKVNKMDRFSAIRIVIMPHVTKKIIDEFIPALEKTCKNFGEI